MRGFISPDPSITGFTVVFIFILSRNVLMLANVERVPASTGGRRIDDCGSIGQTCSTVVKHVLRLNCRRCIVYFSVNS